MNCYCNPSLTKTRCAIDTNGHCPPSQNRKKPFPVCAGFIENGMKNVEFISFSKRVSNEPSNTRGFFPPRANLRVPFRGNVVCAFPAAVVGVTARTPQRAPPLTPAHACATRVSYYWCSPSSGRRRCCRRRRRRRRGLRAGGRWGESSRVYPRRRRVVVVVVVYFCLSLAPARRRRRRDDRDRPFLITVAPVVRVCWHALLCVPVRPSVRPFVRSSVRRSVCPCVCPRIRVRACGEFRKRNRIEGEGKNIRDRVKSRP